MNRRDFFQRVAAGVIAAQAPVSLGEFGADPRVALENVSAQPLRLVFPNGVAWLCSGYIASVDSANEPEVDINISPSTWEFK